MLNADFARPMAGLLRQTICSVLCVSSYPLQNVDAVNGSFWINLSGPAFDGADPGLFIYKKIHAGKSAQDCMGRVHRYDSYRVPQTRFR